MKVGVITKPNEKGQVVLPKEMRDLLGINASVSLNLVLTGSGIFIHPIKEVLTKEEGDNAYLKLLEKTKGAWLNEDWRKLETQRSKIELRASKTRKKTW